MPRRPTGRRSAPRLRSAARHGPDADGAAQSRRGGDRRGRGAPTALRLIVDTSTSGHRTSPSTRSAPTCCGGWAQTRKRPAPTRRPSRAAATPPNGIPRAAPRLARQWLLSRRGPGEVGERAGVGAPGTVIAAGAGCTGRGRESFASKTQRSPSGLPPPRWRRALIGDRNLGGPGRQASPFFFLKRPAVRGVQLVGSADRWRPRRSGCRPSCSAPCPAPPPGARAAPIRRPSPP